MDSVTEIQDSLQSATTIWDEKIRIVQEIQGSSANNYSYWADESASQ